MCLWTCTGGRGERMPVVPYRRFGETSGFLASDLIMLMIAVSLYIVFKHKKWV